MISKELILLEDEISNWRATRSQRAPIPDPIIHKAVEISKIDGVSKVARALGLNTSRLKAAILKSKDQKPSATRSQTKQTIKDELEIVKISPSPTPKLPPQPTQDMRPAAEVVGPAGSVIRLYENCSAEFLSKLLDAWGRGH